MDNKINEENTNKVSYKISRQIGKDPNNKTAISFYGTQAQWEDSMVNKFINIYDKIYYKIGLNVLNQLLLENNRINNIKSKIEEIMYDENENIVEIWWKSFDKDNILLERILYTNMNFYSKSEDCEVIGHS